MAKQPSRQPNHSARSMSGRPAAFSHVKSIRPGFQQAASGAREKQQLRAKAPQLKKQFGKAHEGPREKLATPKKQVIPTPNGNVTKTVNTKVEREKEARNRQRDEQMKKWRERKVPQPTRTDRPKFDLRKTTPAEYLAKAEKKKQRFEQQLLQKQARKRRRGRSR